jgi:hypothetical protein
MTFRNAALAAASAARAIPQALGLRTIRVWIRQSTRSNAALLPGNTTSNVDVEIVPRPAVVEQETVDGSYWGAEAAGLVGGVANAELYQIGPVTPDWGPGGYSWTDLRPITTTPSRATRFLLADVDGTGKLGTTGVEFELVAIKGQDKGRSFRWMLLVRRVRAQGTNG